MLKRIIKAVCIFCLFTVTLSACNSNTTYNDAKSGVVYIETLFDTFYGRGSGFAIGEQGKSPQFIVTNAHCVKDMDYGEATNLVRVYFSAAANKYMDAEIYYINEDKDVAVLRLPEPTDERVPLVLCPSTEVDETGEFYALGFPWTGDAADDYTKYDKSDIIPTRGGIKKQTRVAGRDVYLLDLALVQGNSGGPLVNSKGEVVGINTFSVSVSDTGEQIAHYAVIIDELIFNINRERIPCSITGENDYLMIIVVIICAGAVVLALVIIMFALSKRKSSASKKKSSVPATAKAYITGTNGVFSAQRFDVNDKIVIGRDNSKCAVAFPLDAPGISGVHCEVSFDGTSAYLQDLGSSYGTFLLGGMKLTPNAPAKLETGTKFYVGSDENIFEVSIV